MGKGTKTLIAVLALLLCIAVIWGALVTVRCGMTEEKVTKEQSLQTELTDRIAALETELSEKDKAAGTLENARTALEQQIASLTEQIATLTAQNDELAARNEELAAQAQELQSMTEAEIEAKVEERYPQLVEEITRLKALSAAQMGEELLNEETDAANEG